MSPNYSNKWSTGLFDCTDDLSVVMLYCICSPFLSADTAKKMGGSFVGSFIVSICCGCLPCVSAAGRRAVRDKYNLPPEPLGDCMVYCCFMGSCATCQEAREVNYQIAKPTVVMPSEMQPNYASTAPVSMMPPTQVIQIMVQPSK
jgi:Cys-rich protein (TIGR01571 family)